MTGTQLELFSIDSLTTIPDYIAADSYKGRHVVRFDSRKYRVSVFTASEIADLVPNNGDFPVFESFGGVNGIEHFGRMRFLTDGTGRLFGYDSDGVMKIIYPANRKLRVLVGK